VLTLSISGIFSRSEYHKGLNVCYLLKYVSVHLWRYEGGYPALTEVMSKLKENQVMILKNVCLFKLLI